ncbi:hypothetical protein CHUAL_003379 [Chamberlinius hualienensis]
MMVAKCPILSKVIRGPSKNVTLKISSSFKGNLTTCTTFSNSIKMLICVGSFFYERNRASITYQELRNYPRSNNNLLNTAYHNIDKCCKVNQEC